MKNLKTIEAKVKAILQKNEDARNDDMTLYLIVCNTSRRKLQAKYPELAGNARVRRLRAEGEKAYRKYAKE